MANTLKNQMQESVQKRKVEKSALNEWIGERSPKKEVKKVERTRKINETSTQNVLVELVSPGAVTTPARAHTCADCEKKY